MGKGWTDWEPPQPTRASRIWAAALLQGQVWRWLGGRSCPWLAGGGAGPSRQAKTLGLSLPWCDARRGWGEMRQPSPGPACEDRVTGALGLALSWCAAPLGVALSATL